MTRWRMTSILCTLFVIGIVCLEEWLTIILGNPSNLEKIVSVAIYIYISIFIYIDSFRAVYSKNTYLKLYNILCLARELAIITAVNIVLIVIFVFINTQKMNTDITQLIIVCMIDSIVALLVHKQAIKSWEQYEEDIKKMYNE